MKKPPLEKKRHDNVFYTFKTSLLCAVKCVIILSQRSDQVVS